MDEAKLNAAEDGSVLHYVFERVLQELPREEYLNADPDTIAATVRIRYRHAGERAVITRCGGCVNIELEKPVRAPAPGQACVFYDGPRVVGGGTIIRSE